jgi:hypothetical protein
LICANAITKQFKIGAAYEFLNVRKTIWKIQMVLAITCAIIAYPTVLLVKQRAYLGNDPNADPKAIEKIDYYTFWLFFSGVFKDYGATR